MWLLVVSLCYILIVVFPFTLILCLCVRNSGSNEAYHGTLEISRKEQKKLRVAGDLITTQHTPASVSPEAPPPVPGPQPPCRAPSGCTVPRGGRGPFLHRDELLSAQEPSGPWCGPSFAGRLPTAKCPLGPGSVLLTEEPVRNQTNAAFVLGENELVLFSFVTL